MSIIRRRATPFAASAAAAALLLAGACQDSIAPAATGLAHAPSDHLGRAGDVVALPFRAAFFTDLASIAPDPRCGAPPRFLNIQQGSGEATHLGRFSVRISFCIDARDLLDDGVLSPGESLPYDDGTGTLTAANGDVLHLTIAGAVVPTTQPGFDFEFADPFAFAGGTGRFAGAAGEGMTRSLVNFQSSPSRTWHEWSGTLVVPRGR